MNGLIVFNSANDVIYQRFNNKLNEHLHNIAKSQGLLQHDDDKSLDNNVILQIFSPIINSQRIMHCQFDNTYASLQCDENVNFVFGDLLGYQFVKVAQQPVDLLKRNIGTIMALAKHLYGPNLFSPQANEVQEELFTVCMECYEEYITSQLDQCIMFEAMPILLINNELKKNIKFSLEAALDKLKDSGHNRAHAIMFVTRKFVAIESSRSSIKLSSSDLLFLTLLLYTLHSQKSPVIFNRSVAIFLSGLSQEPHSGCVPCIAHLSQLEQGLQFIQIIEYANLMVASVMYETYFSLQKIIAIQMQGDSDNLKSAYDTLEIFVRQSLDAIKKAKLKGDDLETAQKKFTIKWDNLRKMYGEFLKSFDRELLLRLESNIPAFIEDLRQLFTVACCDSSAVYFNQLPEIASFVEGKLLEFSEFLMVKAERNISIQAYLEDFPGLVHFIYINRSTGLMIMPDLKITQQSVTDKKLWYMLEFTRNYLKKGHTTVMWKDKTFNYAYFLWFEDQANDFIKSIDMQQHFIASSTSNAINAFKTCPFEPGLMAGDYYHRLIETCFPKVAPNKIKCYELYCVHLGLVTATCALEHARRLVATIVDVIGDDRF